MTCSAVETSVIVATSFSPTASAAVLRFRRTFEPSERTASRCASAIRCRGTDPAGLLTLPNQAVKTARSAPSTWPAEQSKPATKHRLTAGVNEPVRPAERLVLASLTSNLIDLHSCSTIFWIHNKRDRRSIFQFN